MWNILDSVRYEHSAQKRDRRAEATVSSGEREDSERWLIGTFSRDWVTWLKQQEDWICFLRNHGAEEKEEWCDSIRKSSKQNSTSVSVTQAYTTVHRRWKLVSFGANVYIPWTLWSTQPSTCLNRLWLYTNLDYWEDQLQSPRLSYRHPNPAGHRVPLPHSHSQLAAVGWRWGRRGETVSRSWLWWRERWADALCWTAGFGSRCMESHASAQPPGGERDSDKGEMPSAFANLNRWCLLDFLLPLLAIC